LIVLLPWTSLALFVALSAPEAVLRQSIGEAALRQARRMDAAWQPAQRDCAGLIRYVYHSAFERHEPSRLEPGLWRGAHNEPLSFADAQTLLGKSFRFLGRSTSTADTVRTGDVLAFRQDRGNAQDAAYHLMLAVAPTQRLHAGYIVYHPGSEGEHVRAGTYASYVRDAPAEWQPAPNNPAFLGYYRFEDWTP
jgi:uncharacterized protein YfaT (DUF1175 family)